MIYITEKDYKKLTTLLNERNIHDIYEENLLRELHRASIVSPKDIPNNVITMNSLVVFSDKESNEQFEYWIVFPQDANIENKKISILSPIGCALLGYKINDTIFVKTPKGEKIIKVEKILHQPEAYGNYE